MLGWLCISVAFWITGGFAGGIARVLLWAVAVLCEYVSPMVGFALPRLGRSRTGDWTIEGGHLAEPCQLFVIVALGEVIIVTGATLADGGAWDAPLLIAFLATFLSSIALWWIYFGTSGKDGSAALLLPFAYATDLLMTGGLTTLILLAMGFWEGRNPAEHPATERHAH